MKSYSSSQSAIPANPTAKVNEPPVGIYIRAVKSARGAEQVAALLAKGFADRGYMVDFLVEDERGWLIEDLKRYNQNIRIRNLNKTGIGRVLERIFRIYAALKVLLSFFADWLDRSSLCNIRLARTILKKKFPLLALSTYVRKQRPSAVISLLNDSNVALLLARCAHKQDTRLIVSVHNTISISANGAEKKWNRSVPDLMRCLFHRADTIVAVSRGVADDLINKVKLPTSNIEAVYNPVVRPELYALAKEPVHHPWLKNKSCPVLIAASKLKPQKDIPTLLQAFALVRKNRPVHLVVLGEGPEHESLRHLAQNLGVESDVDLVGFVQNPFAFFSRADVFVMSSAWEGLPTALIEAMACGCPVVSTDCPSGPAEILENGHYGKLVPIGDHRALATAIEDTLDSPPPRQRLLKRAEYFSLQNSIDHYEALVRRPISDK